MGVQPVQSQRLQAQKGPGLWFNESAVAILKFLVFCFFCFFLTKGSMFPLFNGPFVACPDTLCLTPVIWFGPSSDIYEGGNTASILEKFKLRIRQAKLLNWGPYPGRGRGLRPYPSLANYCFLYTRYSEVILGLGTVNVVNNLSQGLILLVQYHFFLP